MGVLMLRRAVPLTLSVLVLAACSGGGGDDSGAPSVTPVPDSAGEEMPSTPDNLDVSIIPTGKQQEPTANPNSDAQTLATISENRPWSVIITAVDPDGAPLTFTLSDSGNGDAAAFAFETETGTLSLRTLQDFERPMDADGDSRFELMLVANEYPELGGLPFTIDIGDQAEIFEQDDAVLILGATDYGGLGRNAINLGDIDDDGRPDLILAAPGQHTCDLGDDFPPAESNQGEVFVLSGAALSTMDTHSVRDSLPAGVWKLDGTDEDLYLGYSMTTIGDLDEDGLNDVAIARNESEIAILSGAVLAEQMRAGGAATLDDLSYGRLSLAGDFIIDPHAMTALGDLDQDGFPDLGACLRDGTVKLVTAISGDGLAELMVTQTTRSLRDFIAVNQAGYYGRTGGNLTCGRLTALGDVDADGLTDIAIPTPVYEDAGAWVFSGAVLRDWMETGTTHDNPHPFLVSPPYTYFYDPQPTGISQDRVVTRLGDVTGDEVDDFALSWQNYQGADHSAFIIKGAPDVLNNSQPLVADKSARALVSSGRAIALQGPGGNAQIKSVFPILAPEEGLHETLSLVRIGQNRLFSFVASDLPDGGTPELTLPIGASGDLRAPQGNRFNFSEMISIGDLNRDGYGDLAIGYAIADPAHASYRPEDGGVVWLVSGKALFEYRERGDTFDPDHVQPLPPNSRD